MTLMNASAASAVLMDIDTGEIVAMASLPDFDPNARPRPLTEGDQADSPLFNRAVQGVYELGSVFKTFTIAQAMELGLVNLDDMIDTRGPLRMAGFAITDYRSRGAEQSVADVFTYSSNIGTARIARMIGGARQQEFLDRLGLMEPTSLELVEAPSGRPLYPERWGELSTMTISYGHGISTSPVHLAAAYAAMVNGGTMVTPTLLRRDPSEVIAEGERVISRPISARMRLLLRSVVTDGTASFGDVEGYSVGGKTGSAEMPRTRGGGYYEDRNINTFAAVFPSDAPRYVLVTTLYEPAELSGPEPRRTAGWTTVPVSAELIRRAAPLLGLRPDVEQMSVLSYPAVRTDARAPLGAGPFVRAGARMTQNAKSLAELGLTALAGPMPRSRGLPSTAARSAPARFSRRFPARRSMARVSWPARSRTARWRS
jgi:cell division protein FtsI (penicillin-binding protein 3)